MRSLNRRSLRRISVSVCSRDVPPRSPTRCSGRSRFKQSQLKETSRERTLTNKENNHEGFCFGFVCQAAHGRAEEADLAEGSPRHSEALSRRQDRPILVPRG